MLRPVLNASRFLVFAAVLGALAGAAALFLYGLLDTVAVIARTIASGEVSTVGAKQLMLYFIEVFDLFLLGTVMLIMALSLYELFFDSDLKLPARLEIRTFEDLKSNLVTVVCSRWPSLLTDLRRGAYMAVDAGGSRACAESPRSSPCHCSPPRWPRPRPGRRPSTPTATRGRST
jgi:hypothetical protein